MGVPHEPTLVETCWGWLKHDLSPWSWQGERSICWLNDGCTTDGCCELAETKLLYKLLYCCCHCSCQEMDLSGPSGASWKALRYPLPTRSHMNWLPIIISDMLAAQLHCGCPTHIYSPPPAPLSQPFCLDLPTHLPPQPGQASSLQVCDLASGSFPHCPTRICFSDWYKLGLGRGQHPPTPPFIPSCIPSLNKYFQNSYCARPSP